MSRDPSLPLDHSACYAALASHDSRFDGLFFCGVSSTGIYCRPICRVRLPKEGNCTFFPSAAITLWNSATATAPAASRREEVEVP